MVDVARMQAMAINVDRARGRVPDAIRQAYGIVVTVSDKDEVQAFKITGTECVASAAWRFAFWARQ